MIAEGIALVTASLPVGPIGAYKLQAAIAALHDEAATYEDTDWLQIVALYEVLGTLADNPIVALNHAVAVAMAHGSAEGLCRIERLRADGHLLNDYRLHAARGHLLERLGNDRAAAEAFTHAAALATNTQQRRFLLDQARRVNHAEPSPP
jgi:predicted RNA polymerase sigma factor